MSGRDTRADRHVLLELDALLEQIQILVAKGDRTRFDNDDHYRWVRPVRSHGQLIKVRGGKAARARTGPARRSRVPTALRPRAV